MRLMHYGDLLLQWDIIHISFCVKKNQCNRNREKIKEEERKAKKKKKEVEEEGEEEQKRRNVLELL